MYRVCYKVWNTETKKVYKVFNNRHQAQDYANKLDPEGIQPEIRITTF